MSLEIWLIICSLILIVNGISNLYESKPKQHTFIYCDCGNEMCSDGSFISDTYDENGDNHVFYKCKKCGLRTISAKSQHEARRLWNNRKVNIPEHETIEHYKERTNKDYPENRAVYYNNGGKWKVDYYWYAKLENAAIIVTADNSKPDPDWRPE